MKKISYDGIGAVVATFEVESSVASGTVVKMAQSCTVTSCEQGEVFTGVVFDCETPLAAIQVEGFVTLGCTGVIGLGYVSLVADGNGGVMAGGDDGLRCLVVDNEESGYVTLCL